MRRQKRVFSILRIVLLTAAACLFLLPVVYTIGNSLMGSEEIFTYYSALTDESASGSMAFHLFPDRPTLDGFYEILLRRPDYLMKFWNSLLLTGAIVAGQSLLAILAGYGFSKFQFPCKNILFVAVVILMMMPYQVTLVSNYIVLKEMNLIGGYLAVILPGIFSPFGVFLMKQSFDQVPKEMMESAKLDGANQLCTLRRVVLPCAKGGLVCLFLLCFVDNWNMVEQPLVFLKDELMYPLSIFLVQVNLLNLGVSFACGVLAMLPVMLLFAYFEEELAEGIVLASFR